MSDKMHVNRLSQDELTYELKIRGIATGTVDQMRHYLAMALRLEKAGDSVKMPTYPYTMDEDVTAVRDKLAELEPAVAAFNNSSTSGAFLKLQSKLSHVLNRIDHIGEDSADRPELLAKTLSLLDMLHSKSADFEKPQTVPPQLSFMEHAQNPSGTSSPIHSNARMSSVSPNRSPTHVTVKPIMPHKWDIKFAGDKKGLSLSAFLERIEELRVARHVSKEVLLESGIDLFSGRAYQFYLAYRNQVTTWDEFVTLLKQEYLPSTYNEKLFEEIRSRTQGPGETIGIYIAVMTGYFNRLTCPISEDTKLKILLRNIAPFYQTQLALVEVTSITQLGELGRRLEARKEAVENFAAPSRRGNVLEPDLAYVHVPEVPVGSCLASTSSMESGGSISTSKEIVCYRCNQPGHRAIGCAKSRGKFCYKCKKEGVTLKTCPNCAKQGNARRHT